MLSVSPMLAGVTHVGMCHLCWQVSPMLSGVTYVDRCHSCRQVSLMSSGVICADRCLITDRCPVADRYCNYCYIVFNLLTGVTLGGHHTELGKLIVRLSKTVTMGAFPRKIICLCGGNSTIKICRFSILQAFDVRTSG